MTAPIHIDLSEEQFGPSERRLAVWGGLTVTGWRYASGVAALRIRNRVGEIIVLPYHGQQIWDAQFFGRRLTMGSIFDGPEQSDVYTRNYGAFLVHCGVLAVGNPAPEDTHPVHGEVPNARFQKARLVFAEGADGPEVRVWGEREERQAFSQHYLFAPEISLGETASQIGLKVSLKNLRHAPLEFMYLAHVNFRPVDGAEIIDAVPDSPEHFRVRRHLPIYRDGTPDYRALMDQLATNPALHRQIRAGQIIQPELVAGMDCVAGPDGWSHALQLLPDGSADVISHKPSELPRAVRWMTRNGDEEALGLVLPATTEADGRIAERKKGNALHLAPGAEWTCALRFGALDAEGAKHIRAAIDAARK